MTKLLLPLIGVLFSFHLGAATSNVNKSGLALEGYDPVSYFRPEAAQRGPLKGDPKYVFKHDDATYQFSSEANKLEFEKNPNKYAPAFGGWCAYAVAAKKTKYAVDVKSFVIQNGRLLLFYKGFLADTRDKWQNTKAKSATVFLQEADANWPEVKDKES